MDEDRAKEYGAFQRVHRHARPRTNVNIAMVHAVNVLVDPLRVQEPMGQVKMRTVNIWYGDK